MQCSLNAIVIMKLRFYACNLEPEDPLFQGWSRSAMLERHCNDKDELLCL